MNDQTFNCLVNTAYQSWIDYHLSDLDSTHDISNLSDEYIRKYLTDKVHTDSLQYSLKIEIAEGFVIIDYPGASLTELSTTDAAHSHNTLETYVVGVLDSLNESQYNELYNNFTLDLKQPVDLDPAVLLDLISNYGE